jgi:hypothetical protein
MTLSLKELEAVAEELHAALAGSTFVDASTPDPSTAVLRFDAAGTERLVLACIRPRASRIHMTSRPAVAPGPGFASDATRLLAGASVASVRSRYHDRVVAIELRAGRTDRAILFECSGHHPNLFVVESDGVVRAMLAPTHSHLRDLRPGRPYARPLAHDLGGIEAMRFLAPRGGLSARIEEAYAAVDARESTKETAAAVRASLRSAIERDERLAAGLQGDIDEGRRAARWLATLRSRGAADPETARRVERARRVAAAGPDAARRLDTIKGRIAELRRVVATLVEPTAESIAAAEEVARRFPGPAGRKPAREAPPPPPAAPIPPPKANPEPKPAGRRRKVGRTSDV